MPILKIKSQKEDFKLVGALLPIRVHNYITFYSLAKGKTKSDILKELLYKWMSERREVEKDSDLIYEIVRKLDYQWKVEKATGRGITVGMFKDTVREELINKGLIEVYVNKIIDEICK
ncbi:MAG TPA: hypothetical protein VMX17_00085 [Candidatus Glassbacteria bacterium]|nr:hypothetical protein [Candidatus Glassbacteria bacterium]